MSNLTIALVQTHQFWEDKRANLMHFDALIQAQLNSPIDVLILPEMFHTGFTMNTVDMAETMESSVGLAWLKEKACIHECVVIASLIIKEGLFYFNRMLAVFPDGNVAYYDKKYLFSLAREDQYFSEGRENKIITHKGWKINLQVCYDLRFPESCRNKVNETGHFEYDLLVYVANWPEKRIAHWNALLKARAIENQCFVAGVNRVGADQNKLIYNGCSQLINPLGEYEIQTTPNTEGVYVTEILKHNLEEIRISLPFLKDQKKKST